MNDELLSKSMEKWAKAQEKGFASKRAATPTPSNPALFDDWEASNPNQVDSAYWDKLHKMAVLNEQSEEGVKCAIKTEKPDGKTPGEVTDELGGCANPVQQRSRGVDNRSHVTPNWTCGKELVELHNMKKELEQLESKLNAADALAKPDDSRSIKGQIDELWEKIDKLSNYLNPDFVRDYMS